MRIVALNMYKISALCFIKNKPNTYPIIITHTDGSWITEHFLLIIIIIFDGHKPNRDGNITKTSKAHEPSPTTPKSEKPIAPNLKVPSSSEDWMDVVCQYSPRSRVSGWTVTVAMTVLCYYRSEREREREMELRHQRTHCSGGESEWARIGARADDGSGWEGNGIIYHSRCVADDFEWDTSDGAGVSLVIRMCN